MKRRILCLMLVLTLLFTCALTAQATEGTQESTVSTTEATTEATEEPTEATTEPEITIGGSCGANANWSFDENSGVLTISGSGPMDDFSEAPWYAKYRNSITTVIIQPGVTTIGKSAFASCRKITSVSIPSTVTKIGAFAFDYCDFKSITLPASLEHIGSQAFRYNNFTSVDLQNVVTCDTFAFDNCTSLKEVTLSPRLTAIPAGMFHNCYSITEITIPASVKSIDYDAFWSCSSLQVIHFKGNALSIHNRAFDRVTASVSYPAADTTWTEEKRQNYGGNLTWYPEGGSGLQVSGTVGRSDVMEWKIEGSTLYITGNGYMDGWSKQEDIPWFPYRGHIEKIVMQGNIQNVYACAFQDFTKLTEIVWPTGVSSIFTSAFQGCISLRKVALPDSVKSIGEFAFGYCSALEAITLPENLDTIHGNAFCSCTSLQSLTIPANTKRIYTGAFRCCSELKTIYFTGRIPNIDGLQTGIFGAFVELKDVTIYYPAGNSSWTSEKVNTLREQYASYNITFVRNEDITPEQPGGSDVVPEGPLSTTGPGAEQQPGNLEETLTNEQGQPEETFTNEQERTEEEMPTGNTASSAPSDAEDPGSSADPGQNEGSDDGILWIVVVVSVVVVGTAGAVFILWKRKGAK